MPQKDHTFYLTDATAICLLQQCISYVICPVNPAVKHVNLKKVEAYNNNECCHLFLGDKKIFV